MKRIRRTWKLLVVILVTAYMMPNGRRVRFAAKSLRELFRKDSLYRKLIRGEGRRNG